MLFKMDGARHFCRSILFRKMKANIRGDVLKSQMQLLNRHRMGAVVVGHNAVFCCVCAASSEKFFLQGRQD